MGYTIPRVKPGETIKAETINTLIDAAERVFNARGSNGIAVQSNRGGLTVSMVRPIIPGRGGQVAIPIETLRIVAFDTGFSGAANSGVNGWFLDDNGQPITEDGEGNPITPTAVWFCTHPGEGTDDLTRCTPNLAVGRHIRVQQQTNYLSGAWREGWFAVSDFQLMCAPAQPGG